MSETTEAPVLVFGTCPICGKGQIVKKSMGYSCNHFVSSEDKCDFIIFNTYFDKQVTPEIVQQLIEKKETEIFSNFHTKAGEKFSASLKIEDGRVKVNYQNEELNALCPKCGTGHIYVGKKAFNCSNYKNDDLKCDFTIWKETSGRLISAEEAILLCQNKETDVLSGFKKKDGTPIEGKLIINEEFKIILV